MHFVYNFWFKSRQGKCLGLSYASYDPVLEGRLHLHVFMIGFEVRNLLTRLCNLSYLQLPEIFECQSACACPDPIMTSPRVNDNPDHLKL